MTFHRAAAALALLLAACQSGGPTKEELEAAKNTVDCQRDDERLIIRFDEGEARILMPDATRVVLYQVPQASGLRYTNGLIELRGKGLELTWIREGLPTALKCKPYEIPKKE
jgi:membrane-bound inhibitor of C-type lysozyme